MHPGQGGHSAPRDARTVDDVEVPLDGGNATEGVVRVGSTVRKPWSDATPTVHRFMHHVREAGVDVPAVLGRDERGRQVLEMVPGRLAMELPRSSHAAGREPWGSMYTSGHGEHWRVATRYAETHEETSRVALRGR